MIRAWVSLEAILNPRNITVKPLDYSSILVTEGTLKTIQQLKQENIDLDWWQKTSLLQDIPLTLKMADEFVKELLIA